MAHTDEPLPPPLGLMEVFGPKALCETIQEAMPEPKMDLMVVSEPKEYETTLPF